jgi:hypothetical protein
MRPYLVKNCLTRLGLILAAFVFGTAATVYAQSQLELPPPPQHTAPPPVSHSQNSETIPSNPALTQQPSSPPPEELPDNAPQDEQPEAEAPPPVTSQPILPAIFRGCWQGTVFDLDDIEFFPGAPRDSTWTPKTYFVCYRRTGNGPFELTFNQAGIEHDSRIFNANGSVQLLSTSGNEALMQAFLHFDEHQASLAGLFGFGGGSSSFPVNESTKLRCVVDSHGMQVWATVYGTREGQPWFQAHWHALFLPVPT